MFGAERYALCSVVYASGAGSRGYFKRHRVFIDGKPLVDFYSAGNTLGTIPHGGDFGPDGAVLSCAR
jgi:hypothetical protein